MGEYQNWSSAIKMIHRSTGRPYLYYNLQNAKNKIAMNANTMNTILRSQQGLFYQRFNASNNANFSQKEIDELLNDWTTNGVVGQKLAAQMDNIVDLMNSGTYGTSGGVSLGDGVSLSNALSVFNTSKKKALESCSVVVEGVDKYINATIDLLAKNNEFILVQEIAKAYDTGKPLPSEYNQKQVSRSMLTTSETKVVQLIQTIKQNIDGIKALAQNGQGMKQAEVQDLYRGYIGSLKAAFNSLGGTIHEVAFAHGVNVAAGVGNGAIKKSEKEIANIVKRSGGTFYSQWNAQDTNAEGKETKNDVTIFYNKNGITVNLGGSIKLRQGRAFKGSGKGSELLGVSGLVAKGESYDSITRKLESYVPGINQYGYSMMGAWEGNEGIAGVTGHWWLMKQFAGAIIFVDALAGSGAKGDFSSLFIVNNRVFSVADILKKVLSGSGSLTQGGGKYPFEVHGLNYTSIQKKIKEHRK